MNFPKITLLHPATFKLDGGAMFGIIPKPLWAKKIMPDEFNRILMSLRVVLIQTETRNILIDTGIGSYHNEKFNQQFAIDGSQNPLVNILEKDFNLTPDKITDIILTHLHFDHVGGLAENLNESTPVFPDAKIHVHKKHFEYAQEPTLRDKGSFQNHFYDKPMEYYLKKGQVNFIEAEEGCIILEEQLTINFKISFGHTPYMLHPIINNKYIYMADLVPMSHHINIPWVMGYDIEPGTTTKYKDIFYQYILKNDLTLIFEHDLEYWGAKIEQDDRGQYKLKNTYPSTKENSERIDHHE